MLFDGSYHQLPDTDPGETQEWLESLDAVVDKLGRNRARYLLSRLLARAQETQVSFPASVSTPYINTIPRESEPWFPGDEHIERRIRAFIRWNAAVMVSHANHTTDGIGGHLSTFASSASLYEIGFNHFFRGPEHPSGGDCVYFQGHASPGVYARAYLEGRLPEQRLENFRRELSPEGGLSSYPHPRLMPDFWQFPTVSMGLGPLMAIYQARFMRYLEDRGLIEATDRKVWAYLGDGETDEPEALGALHVAADEGLLAFGPSPPAGARATLNLSPTGDLAEAAANLFAHLRALDAQRPSRIAVMPIPEAGLGLAINDRLRRAATDDGSGRRG